MNRIIIVMFSLSLIIAGCKKEEITDTTTTTTTTTTSTTLSKTEVLLNVIDLENNIKSDYTVMMFLEMPSDTSILPTIQMQVISDSKGIAKFDLDNYIVNPTKLYFEAFKKNGDDYIWKSITHPSNTISKGTSWSTSIVVN